MNHAGGLARRLVDSGRLDPAALQRAMRLHEASGEPLHVVLAKLGMVAERDLAEMLAEQSDLPLVRHYPDLPLAEVSGRFLKDRRCVPAAEDGGALVLAMADPTDEFARAAVALATGRLVRAAVGVPADIEAAIERLYGSGKTAVGQLIEEIGDRAADAEEDVARLRDLAGEAPVIRLVNAMIVRAVESRASDIHIEPCESRLRVRYRIDGVLRDSDAPPPRLQAAVISRIKIMARLNIAERRLPQDGRMKLSVRGREIDLRVSTMPMLHGEGVVLRILDKGGVTFELAALGFDEESLAAYLGLLARPNSVLLVTGPTGSGKTTTLYGSLRLLNTPETKIVSVEDPVEYQIEGVNQIQVKPQIGLGFAQVLRSILRHDPDVVMIGEIRDLETAQIAVQAALTGHLVLSTLHTNSAAATVTRLLDMGIEDYLVTSTVNGVAAQRLVRRLCPHCREPYRPLPELVAQTGLGRLSDDPTLWRGRGCAACDGTGYHGRTSLFEVLVLGEPLRRLVLRRAEAAEIERAAVAEGMRTIYENGLRKALAGDTSLEEVLRVSRENA